MALRTIRNTTGALQALNRDDVVTAATERPAALSRRELLTLSLAAQRVLPRVEADKCRGRNCALCAEFCPPQAIKFEDNALHLNIALCDGCGICLSVCPYQAMACQDYGPAALETVLSEALTDSDLLLLTSREVEFDGIATVCLPHDRLITPWLLLRALTLGARGILIDFEITETLEASLDFSRELLGLIGDDPARVAAVSEAEDMAAQIGVLHTLGAVLMPLVASTGEGVPLTDLMHRINLPADGIAIGTHVPFGWLEIQAAKCSSCGVCADICPTGALISGAGGEISFRHDLCVACGRCARHCPEQCLTLTRRLDLARWHQPPLTLQKADILYCRNCGAEVAPRATIAALRARLDAAGIKDTDYIELCAECKLRRGAKIR